MLEHWNKPKSKIDLLKSELVKKKMASNATDGRAPLDVPLWIDNAPEHTPHKFEVKNSTSQEVLWTASGADVEVANKAVESASKAFVSWSRSHPTERRRILLRAAELFRSREQEIIDVMVQETNCTREWAKGINMTQGVRFLEEIASLVTSAAVGSIPPTESESACR
jgi:acyl-CoA reductase-like NAD-dependent aldehyde dehydrogenase